MSTDTKDMERKNTNQVSILGLHCKYTKEEQKAILNGPASEMMLEMGILPEALILVREAEDELENQFALMEDVCQYNQIKVLKAMQKEQISDMHFSWTTGYGYDDAGRSASERVFANIFGAEAALVRPTIANGTHALGITLMGLLGPGDRLIYLSGRPYDTMEEIIGVRGENMGSLKEMGVKYNQVDLKAGRLDFDAISNAITEDTKVVAIQRSTGYSWREALPLDDIERAASLVHSINPKIVVMVDNCYGEFLYTKEPIEVGADICAGSLIKNPGGGLALSGGYVVGRKNLVEKVSYRMTCPGIGGECGLTFGQTRTLLQGLFLAPQTVKGAVKGAILCGKVFEKLGFEVCPKPSSRRSDIIQAIKFKNPELLVEFCQGIQAAAPVDSHVTPMPWDMPGYEDQVIMASGAFVAGSSIELSADGPMRKPFIGYFQGGLTYEHSKFGVINSLSRMIGSGKLTGKGF